MPASTNSRGGTKLIEATLTYGILTFSFLYIFVNFNDPNGKHQILRFASFFFALFFMFLLATSNLLTAANNCENLLANTTESVNNITNAVIVEYAYTRSCDNYLTNNSIFLIGKLPYLFVFLAFYWLFKIIWSGVERRFSKRKKKNE